MKTVLLHLIQTDQTELWQKALATHNLQVICLPTEVELITWLTDRAPNLPDLVLLDMGLKASDGNTLKAGSVGRWLKDCQAKTALILVNWREEVKIKDMEKRWTQRQNAIEVLPRISQQSLLEQMQVVTRILQIPFDQQALLPIALPKDEEVDTTTFGSLVSAEAYSDRARLRLLQLNFSGALYDIERAIEMSPDAPEYYCLRAEITLSMGSKEAAIADVDRALQLYPQYPEAFYTRGLIHYRLGSNQPAIVDFDQAIRVNNKYYEAHNARGLARFNSGDERGAMQDYNQSLRLNSNYAEAYNNRGTLRYTQGDVKGAIQDFGQAIAINPDYADAYYNRGNVYSDTGDFKTAISDYTNAIRCNPEFAQAFGNRGMSNYETDKYRDALIDTQTAAELFKKQGDLTSYQQAMATYRQMQAHLG